MKKHFFVFFAIILFLLGQIFAAADTWVPPASFEIQSKDGSKVFRFEPDSDNHSTAALYDSSDPPKEIYTVENLRSWAYENNFFFSEDFMNFVFIPPADFEIALEFYTNGKLKKTYYIRDLVKDHSKISYSETSAWWQKTGVKASRDNNTLTFTTVDDLTYKINLVNGDILKEGGNSSRNFLLKAIIFFLMGLLIAGSVILLLLQRKPKPYLYLFG